MTDQPTRVPVVPSGRWYYAVDLQKPRVTAVFKSFAPVRTYVGGEVNNPGEFISVGPTLTQAIARAGGAKLSSDNDSVFIIRRDAWGKPQLLGTRYDVAIHARDANADVRLASIHSAIRQPEL